MSDLGFTRRVLVVEDDPFEGAQMSEVLRSHGFEAQVEHTAAVAQGLTNAAIAERRGTTRSGVEQTLTSIIRALGIATMTRSTRARS